MAMRVKSLHFYDLLSMISDSGVDELEIVDFKEHNCSLITPHCYQFQI